MTFVVTNEKIFQEFDTLEEAKQYYKDSSEYGLRVMNRDLFGNLTPVPEEQMETLEKEAPKKKPEPKKEEPEKPKKKEEPTLNKYIKYSIVGLFIVIILFMLFRLILPMLLEFLSVWNRI